MYPPVVAEFWFEVVLPLIAPFPKYPEPPPPAPPSEVAPPPPPP